MRLSRKSSRDAGSTPPVQIVESVAPSRRVVVPRQDGRLPASCMTSSAHDAASVRPNVYVSIGIVQSLLLRFIFRRLDEISQAFLA